MCFVSDHPLSIEYAVQSIYLGIVHEIYAHHLLQNMRTSYGYVGKNIVKPFYAVARAYTSDEFDYHMRQLDKINEGVRKDLVSIISLIFFFSATSLYFCIHAQSCW